MTVNMRCGMYTAIYTLSKEDVSMMRLDNPEFNKKLQLTENKYLKLNKSYPLDYSQPVWIPDHLPKFSHFNSLDERRVYEGERVVRENVLKNIVYRKLIAIRFENSKPRIADILKAFKA